MSEGSSLERKLRLV